MVRLIESRDTSKELLDTQRKMIPYPLLTQIHICILPYHQYKEFVHITRGPTSVFM